MRDLIVLSHKRTVGSGSALARALGVRCITPKNTRPIPEDALLLNYGVSSPLPFVSRHDPALTLNCSVPVGTAVNKVACLDKLRRAGVSVPEFTTDVWETKQWFSTGHSSRQSVFARTLTRGSQGRGIYIFDSFDSLVCEYENRYHSSKKLNFQLFTRNVPKTKEYRVHVFNGQVIGLSQKRQMSEEKLELMGIAEVNRKVRSYKNGWVFANEVQGSESGLHKVKTAGVDAAEALGLTFCAVDVLTTGSGNSIEKVYVCEVNTAPSLDGETTLSNYIEAIEVLRNEN
jgi:hypothetical protein